MPVHIDGLSLAIETHNEQIKEADKELKRLAEADEVCSRLMTVPGIGPVTGNFAFSRQGLSRQFGRPVSFVIGGPTFDELAGWHDIMQCSTLNG